MQVQMSAVPDFRTWAAQVARQAGEEPNESEAQRLMRIAEYWVRLAERDDGQSAIARSVKTTN